MRSNDLIVKNDFFFNLFEQQILPEPISSIEYSRNLGFNLLEQRDSQKLNNRTLYSIKSVPEYITPKVNPNYSLDKVKQYHKGYAIIIEENFADVDTYLKFKFKTRAKEIKRYVKRLEICYDISYKMYFGEISKTEYDGLFETLRSMLAVRFKQKKEVNDRLLEWKRLKDMCFALINDYKASIFVIYESNRPISLSLNYIFGKFYFNAIASYDINYSKFGLGNVIIYKQLQWCINNKFSLYEMGRGDYNYKIRWSNYAYPLDHYIAIPKKASFFVLLLSKIEVRKIELFEFLRRKKVNVVYNNIKSQFYRLRSSSNSVSDYETIKMHSQEKPKLMQLINFEDEEFLKLQKPINDFLFSHRLHKKNINVYKADKAYVLEGNDAYQKVIFK